MVWEHRSARLLISFEQKYHILGCGMPNIKIKPCPYAVIISASFWLKQQESVWLLNTHTHPLKSAEFPWCSPFPAQEGRDSLGSGWALFLVLKRDSRARALARAAPAAAICACRLQLNDIKQTSKHICSRDSDLKITVPWHKCADLKLTGVYSWITLGWLHATATFCSKK